MIGVLLGFVLGGLVMSGVCALMHGRFPWEEVDP